MITDGPPRRPGASHLRLNLDGNVRPVLPSQQMVGTGVKGSEDLDFGGRPVVSFGGLKRLEHYSCVI